MYTLANVYQNEFRELSRKSCALESQEGSGREFGCPSGPAGRYLFASDEQGRDPEQLETVCSHRRGGKKAVQNVHRQAQRLEGEAELAVHRYQPAEQLTAGFRRYLPGRRKEAIG